MKQRVLPGVLLALWLAGMLLTPGTGFAQDEDMGRVFGPGNGIRGTVTAAAADSFTIRTDEGDSYKVLFSVNTRLMKDREPIEASDVHVGDMLVAGGVVDAKAKTVGAVFVLDIDAKTVREARAGFGKTWIMGKVTAIHELKITIERAGDKQAAVVAVDENTSFRKRKEDVTLADIKVGDFINAEGGLHNGSFLATTLRIMPPRTQPGPPVHP
jgi:preprotein translocase subunit YajC